jgi:hypothetical protein
MNKKGPITSIIFTPFDDQAPGAGVFQSVEQDGSNRLFADILIPSADADGSTLDEIKNLKFGLIPTPSGEDPFTGLDADGAAVLLPGEPTTVAVTLENAGTVKRVDAEFNTGTTPLALVCWCED